MTVAEGRAFLRAFAAQAFDLLDRVQVVICPPCTAIWPLAQTMPDPRIELGAQNLAATTDPAHTGEISATLLAEAGCRWAMLGHWEVRRNLGDDDARVNHKLHLALEAGLTPVLLVGEMRGELPTPEALAGRIEALLAGCRPEQVATMACIYEPEEAIGADAPAQADRVAAGCAAIRSAIGTGWGTQVAQQVRIIYGGSVAAEHAPALLAAPDVDGLGAGRRGRDPAAFAAIVRQIASHTWRS